MTNASNISGASRPTPVKPQPAPSTPANAVPAGEAASFSSDSFKSATRRQDRYKIQADLIGCRLYVVDKKTGEPVSSYLISPGTKQYPTQGDHFTIDRTLVRAPWNPPKSAWAKNAKVVPGGPQNPMGIFKMSLGAYSEYIHGTPDKERKDLGKPASHGCLRMSNENVLQLFQLYAGVGSEVSLTRDPKESARLKAALEAKGLKDHAITDGAELLPDAIKGKAPTPIE